MKKLIFILLALLPLCIHSQIDFTINGIKYTVLGEIIQEDKGRQDYLMISNDSIIYTIVYWSRKDTANPFIYGFDQASLTVKDCKKIKESFVAQYGTGSDQFFQAGLFFKSNVVCASSYREGRKKIYKLRINQMSPIFTLKEKADNFVEKYFKVDD